MRSTILARLVACLLLLAVRSAAAEPGWSIEPVASYLARIPVPQIAADAAGTVHIVSEPNLLGEPWRHFTGTPGGFREEPIPGFSTWRDNVGILATDPAGALAILGLIDDDYDYIAAIARPTGAGWHVEGLPVAPGFAGRAMAMDGEGRIHAVFTESCEDETCGCAGRAYAVRYAAGVPGGDFASSRVATGCGGSPSHVAIDVASDHRVHIAWMSGSEDRGEVRHASGAGQDWQVSLVATVEERSVAWAQAIDLAVDSRGRPHLVFHDTRDPKPRVFYATTAGKRWRKQSLGPLTVYPSIAVGPDDAVHVVMDSPFPGIGKLRYAERRRRRWRKSILTPLLSDTPSDVSVDAAGVVHVAFYDQVAGTLRYARRVAK